MRTAMTRRLPLLLACACALSHTGCGAAPTAAGSPASRAPNPAGPSAAHVEASLPALPELRLDALARPRPALPDNPRNPFRFGAPTPAPDHPPSSGPMPAEAAAELAGAPFPRQVDRTAGDAQPAATAGDGLRLIGIVEAPRTAGPVAVLTDARGVHHGRLGDAVDGRYRIVAFWEAEVEIEDLARGVRRTLTLKGS